jgi:hypothetical protein
MVPIAASLFLTISGHQRAGSRTQGPTMQTAYLCRSQPSSMLLFRQS